MRNGMKLQVSKIEGEKLNITTKNKFRKSKRPCDRLGLSANLFIILLATALLCLAVPVMHTCFRSDDDSTKEVIQSLNLSNLSVIGSGRPFRHPEGIIASVNLNFSPHFGHVMTSPEYLILKPPKYSKEYDLP